MVLMFYIPQNTVLSELISIYLLYLIRVTILNVPSWESTGESVVLEWEKYCENELGIKELYELYTLLKQNEMGSNSKREIIVV